MAPPAEGGDGGESSSFHASIERIDPTTRARMTADNTSAFNCRFVAGSDGVWSEHAYGRALDLNPLENPY